MALRRRINTNMNANANSSVNNTNYNNHYQKPRAHPRNGKNVKIGATTMHPYRAQNYHGHGHGHGHMTHTNNKNTKRHKHGHCIVAIPTATALKETQSTPHNKSYGNNTNVYNKRMLEKPPPTQSIKSMGSIYSMETQTSISIRSNNGSNMDEQKGII